MKKISRFIWVIWFLFFMICPPCRGQDRIILQEWFRQAKVLLEKTDSYTAVFHKQERIKGTLKTRETVQLNAGLTGADFDPNHPKSRF